MILVNFKIYKQTFGRGAVKLAQICQEVAKESGQEIIPVVSALDLREIKEKVGGKVFIQSVDPYLEGAKTGYISPIAAREAGADGALINHSEHRLKPGTIRQILATWPKGMTSVVCVQSWGQVERWAARIRADVVAYEPKYLIGSTTSSVSEEKPEMIRRMAETFAPRKVLAGAGVKSVKDVREAVKMGAAGVLVASDVVKAKEPKRELLEMTDAFSV